MSRARPERLSGDRGAAATELVLITPALVMLLLLLVYAGRVAGARGDVQAAARDGARAASLARSGATRAGEDAIKAALDQRGVRCAGYTPHVKVEGGYATVTVDCDIDTNILGPLGGGITTTVSETAVEVIDVYRGQ